MEIKRSGTLLKVEGQELAFCEENNYIVEYYLISRNSVINCRVQAF